MDYEWVPQDEKQTAFALTTRASGEATFTATRCDLVFGSQSELRGVSEVYASADGHERLVKDFVAAWHKVMMLDRFDVPEARKAVMSMC